jgi:hypothetical protein
MIKQFENWTPEQLDKKYRKEQTAIRKKYKAKIDNAGNDLAEACFGAWKKRYFANKQWREKVDSQIMESFTTGFLVDIDLDEAILRISFGYWSQWLNRKKNKKHSAQSNVKCPKVAVWGTTQTTNRKQVKPSISTSKLAQFRQKTASSMKQQQPVSLNRAIRSHANQKRVSSKRPITMPPMSTQSLEGFKRCAVPATGEPIQVTPYINVVWLYFVCICACAHDRQCLRGSGHIQEHRAEAAKSSRDDRRFTETTTPESTTYCQSSQNQYLLQAVCLSHSIIVAEGGNQKYSES